jgi:DNA-binding response OmpR family regulator
MKKDNTALQILLVDDDTELHALMKVLLKAAGHILISAYSGDETLRILLSENVDMVILDVTMPDMDGLQVLKMIRDVTSIPVLMLTAVSTQNVIQQAFLLGADDYLVKPFTPQLILERINALRFHVPDIASGMDVELQTSSIQLSPASRKCLVNARIVELSEIEVRLLAHFMRNPEYMQTHESLLQAGWGRDGKISPQDVEMLQLAVNRLRAKIEIDVGRPIFLPLTNSEGYIFHAE